MRVVAGCSFFVSCSDYLNKSVCVYQCVCVCVCVYQCVWINSVRLNEWV